MRATPRRGPQAARLSWEKLIRLEVGFAHAVGAALRPVLGLLPCQVPALLAARGRGIDSWQRPAVAGIE